MSARTLSDEHRHQMNMNGISVDMGQRYSKRALRTLELYKNLPRDISKSTWSKERLVDELRPGGPRMRRILFDRSNVELEMDRCMKYPKAFLSEYMRDVLDRYPGADRRWSKRDMCTVAQHEREVADLQLEVEKREKETQNVMDGWAQENEGNQQWLTGLCEDYERKINRIQTHLNYHGHKLIDNTDEYIAARIQRMYDDSRKIEKLHTTRLQQLLEPVEETKTNYGTNNGNMFQFTTSINHTLVKKVQAGTSVEIDLARQIRDRIVLSHHAPGFMLLNPKEYRRAPDNVWYIFLENCGNQSLRSWLRTKTNDHMQTLSVMFEIFWSLYAAQTYIPNFRHNDLHLDNIMLVPEQRLSRHYHYTTNDDTEQLFICAHDYMPMIIGLGRGGSDFSRKDIPPTDIEITNRVDYAFDAFYICLHLYHELKNRPHIHRSIKEFLKTIIGPKFAEDRQLDRTKLDITQKHNQYKYWMNNHHFIRDHILEHKIFKRLSDDTKSYASLWYIGRRYPRT